MRSPTAALLWEIWRRNHQLPWAIAALTIAAWVAREPAPGAPNPMTLFLAMPSFLLLFAIFNYTESTGGSAGVAAFPPRLFRLPISSLRLVALPMLTGVVAIEVLYLAWMPLLTAGGQASAPFVAALMGAWMVFYQGALWMLGRLRALRMVGLGVITIGLFALSVVPSFPPTPAPWWRTEPAVALLVTALAGVTFLLSWRHVVLARSGRVVDATVLPEVGRRVPVRLPRRFKSAAAAQFWFEWRNSGMALPVVVGCVLVAVVAPMSWVARDNPGDTARLLAGILLAPVIVAIPLGMAFAKVVFWADDLSVPAFLAVRPLSSEAFVAVKVRVAVVTVLVSWALVFGFIAAWLSLWGSLDGVALPAPRTRVLLVAAAILLTWRFLVNRLWSGLSASRPLVLGSAISVPLVIAAGLLFEPAEFVTSVTSTPGWWTPLLWVAGVTLALKFVLAAYAWRGSRATYWAPYLALWCVGTAVFVSLAVTAPIAEPTARVLAILVALLVMPLARVGLAPASLTRNRHR